MQHAHLVTLASMLLLTLATVAVAMAYAVAQGALVARVRIDADVRILPAKEPPAAFEWPIKRCCSKATVNVLWAKSQVAIKASQARMQAMRRIANVQALERLKLNADFDALISDFDRRESTRAMASMFQHRRFAS